jgi:LPS O-antigen subunit length determinant protein (WzzB/FepE family)
VFKLALIRDDMQNNNSIDILDFMRLFLNKKKAVLIIIGFMMMIGIIYVLFIPRGWTTTTVVTQYQESKTKQIEEEKVVNVFGSENTINSFFSQKDKFALFFNEFNLIENKDVFASKYIIKENINNFISGIDAIRLGNNRIELKLQCSNKECSEKLLKDYVSYIKSLVTDNRREKMTTMIDNKLVLLNINYYKLKEEAIDKLNVEKIKTQYSLRIAKAANVIYPLTQMNKDEFFNIELGEKGLEEKLKILDSLTDLSLISPEINNVASNINSLDNININNLINSNYISNNNKYVSKVNNSKAVYILLLSFIFGLLFSSLFVLSGFFKKEGK